MGKKQLGAVIVLIALAATLLLSLAEGFGLFSVSGYQGWITTGLVFAGLIVGFLNVSKSESSSFLLATIAISILAGVVLPNLPLNGFLDIFFTRVATLISPAALVVALGVAYNKVKN